MPRSRSPPRRVDPRTTRSQARAKAKPVAYPSPSVTWQGNRHQPMACPGPPGRPCLLRVSPPHALVADEPKLARRYQEELLYTSALGDENIAPKLYQGEVLEATMQLAMVLERFDEDLDQYLSRNQDDTKAGRLVGEQIVELVRHIANFKLFHADLKPKNIVVSSSQQHLSLRLIDFDPKYMSKASKDEALVRAHGPEQTAALYAVSMIALLHLHLSHQFLNRSGVLSELPAAYKSLLVVLRGALETSELPLHAALHVHEPEIQALDCKFYRILARQLHHYHLTDSYFWNTRVKSDELKVDTAQTLLRHFEGILLKKFAVGNRPASTFNGRAVVIHKLDVSETPEKLSRNMRARALAMSNTADLRSPSHKSLTPSPTQSSLTPSHGDQPSFP